MPADATLLPIVQLGNPVLRTRTRDVSAADIASPHLGVTVGAMQQTMYAAPGVGLAAPQVGLDIRLCVLEDREESIGADPDAGLLERAHLPFTVMINASYSAVGDERREFWEGCLSMSGYRALVLRWYRVSANWTDEHGSAQSREFSGWQARIVQHEIDHLDGIVYVDRCLPRSLSTSPNVEAFWGQNAVSEARTQMDVDRPL